MPRLGEWTDPMEVTEAYKSDAVASSYDCQRFSSLKGKLTDYLEKRAFRKALSHCGAEGAFLDLACGTGRFTKLLAASGYRVIGADVSWSMLKEAQRKSTEPGIIGFVCCDAKHLPFKDKALKNLGTMRFLGHWPHQDRLEILLEARRITKENLIAGYFNPRTLQGLRRRLMGWLRGNMDNCLFMDPQSDSQAANLQLQQGFSILSLISGTKVIFFKAT